MTKGQSRSRERPTGRSPGLRTSLSDGDPMLWGFQVHVLRDGACWASRRASSAASACSSATPRPRTGRSRTWSPSCTSWPSRRWGPAARARRGRDPLRLSPRLRRSPPPRRAGGRRTPGSGRGRSGLGSPGSAGSPFPAARWPAQHPVEVLGRHHGAAVGHPREHDLELAGLQVPSRGGVVDEEVDALPLGQEPWQHVARVTRHRVPVRRQVRAPAHEPPGVGVDVDARRCPRCPRPRSGPAPRARAANRRHRARRSRGRAAAAQRVRA